MRTFAAAALVVLSSAPAFAYTAAGDRVFPATILLPQNAPSDDFYITPSTQPFYSGSEPGGTDRLNNLSFTYDKTLTERLSVGLTEGWNQFQQAGAGNAYGFQNLETMVQYLAVLDPDHEFLLSVGADREWGNGAQGIGASPSGATTPAFYFGKGMGDLPVPALRPFAITGSMGYQLADQNTRPDLLVSGIAIEYSIPYLVAKVANPDLPDFVRALTPMVELLYTTPISSPRGATTVGTIAPGISYAGEGWELGAELLVPATRAAGNGVGFTAQLHLALDYLFPDTLGRPIFPWH